MATVHIISHTHWDREWYQTFQQIRLRLVHMLDKLLAILAEDPDYRYFMLDGQTVVLEDYLDMRPEKEAELRAHIATGRILIGPWRCLPDEFLVSPESIIRNLLQGKADCARFGKRMEIGYIPDTFGHIGQMPQIVRGFGFPTACVWRGLAEEPCELWWEAPDCTRVLLAYLRDSYSNATGLPASTLDKSTAEIRMLAEALLPHAASGHVLLMHGTDHKEPHHMTSRMVAHAAQHLEDYTVRHSTLAAYLAAMHDEIARSALKLPVVRGELRACRRQHLLPGVLSARMWIKQRNHACETLLEKWTEPYSAWAGLRTRHTSTELKELRRVWCIDNTAPLVRRAWRLLMECHPHDSICGCSIDQVHAEMASRFDQVEQIGEEITQQSLQALCLRIATAPAATDGSETPLVVFNPISAPRTDLVSAHMFLPMNADDILILDDTGATVPHVVLTKPEQTDIFNANLDRDGLLGMLDMAREGRIPGMKISNVRLAREEHCLSIDIALCDSHTDGGDALQAWSADIDALLADDSLDRYHLHARLVAHATVQFTARDIPGYGYRTYWVKPAAPNLSVGQPALARIENEYFLMEANADDGTLALTDKRTGMAFTGLNRFADGGDCGDEYNYSPPANDSLTGSLQVRSVRMEADAVKQSLEMELVLPVPLSLNDDRRSRSNAMTELAIITRAELVSGVQRVDITTRVKNTARDHRLRVHFPVPVTTDISCHDGHFEVVERSVGLPEFDDSWVEDPRPEVPQRAFTDVSDGTHGLMLANRGLPEVEVGRAGAGMEIALTLLRCVGWLSREDFTTRKGHAGPPAMATPDAQMPGTHTFAYSLIPHMGPWRTSYMHAQAFATPLRAIATTLHEGILPCAGAYLTVDPPEFVISAVKQAEDGAGIIVRGYNIGEQAIDVTLTPGMEFASAARCRLDETHEAALPRKMNGAVRIHVRGKEIVSIRLGEIG